MAFVYKYIITQRELNHTYARKTCILKKLLLDIYGSEDLAYSEENWYFLTHQADLYQRIQIANVAEDYLFDESNNPIPTKLYDENLEVYDEGYGDCDKYRTYTCVIRTILDPKHFQETLRANLMESTNLMLEGLHNRTGVEPMRISLEGSLSDHAYEWEKKSETPVVIENKAYHQMVCKRSGKEVLKEIEILL